MYRSPVETKLTREQFYSVTKDVINKVFWLIVVIFALAMLAYVISLIVPSTQPTADILSVEELKAKGAYIQIDEITPSPDTWVFKTGVETSVTVMAKYNLPGNATSPAIGLKYLSGNKRWNVMYTAPVEVGVHSIRLSGVVEAPDPTTLDGEPFQLAVSLDILDRGTGTKSSVASDRVEFRLEK